MPAANPLAFAAPHDAQAFPEAAHASTHAHAPKVPKAQATHPGEGRASRRLRSSQQVGEAAVDRSQWMGLQLRQVGDFRIYAGALGAPDGGFIAAVEVHRIDVAGEAAEAVFRSASISGSHRFDAAALALRHALDVGHQAVRLHLSPDV